MGRVEEWLEAKSREYEVVHKEYEDQFWGTKMNLQEGSGVFSSEKLTEKKQAMEDWLRNPTLLKEVEDFLESTSADTSAKEDPVSEFDLKTLKVMKRTFETYQMAPEPKKMRDEITALESVIEEKRNAMKSGYRTKDGEFKQCTSVALRQMIRNSAEEDERKAAWKGVREIGPFIIGEGFLEIVKKRNEMAKKLGYEDFYDLKVTQAEGFGKTRLFEMLDDLEKKTRPGMVKAIACLKERKGETAFEPWNLAHKLAGDLVKKQDPYFPFEKAVERYAQCYANMGIEYKQATMNLDLLDRPKKYSNGFCHWPQVAWQSAEKGWVPSQANFTSLAIPSSVGSGKTALTTLMHEAGHAAHFANIRMGSPLFSQERAPTSVAYAENQSMFLDSLVDDADWKAKYAKSREGEPIPFELIEEATRETQPFEVFMLRNMLVVCYFEKALYELPVDLVTNEHVLELADKIETDICGGLMGRPVLSVPHILSDESSCYYHGYVLAEMSVHQTREYFMNKYGYLADNPNIGPELTESYWKCGNSEIFLDLVNNLTGKPLSADAWVAKVEQSVEDVVKEEKELYEKMVAREKAGEGKDADPETLNMCIRMVHGDELISDSKADGGILPAARKFEEYVKANCLAKL